jgi:TnpA family transposase
MRLRVFSEQEIDDLYERPRFTQPERDEYFALSAQEKAALEQFHPYKSKLFFMLQLGYFKARLMFFVFRLSDAGEDAAYLKRRYFPDFNDAGAAIAKGTRLKQQKLILELCNYRNTDAAIRKNLQARARQAAAVCGKPIYVFRELMHHLAEQRVVIPGYSTMQNIVGQALAYEQRRLAHIVHNSVDPAAKSALDCLLADTQGLHEITLLKRDPRDFSNAEIRREVQRGEQMRELYELSQKLLPQLHISHENIKYYATLVDYYSVYKLRQLSGFTVYVYLLCFIRHRYQKLHDNLIQSLLHHVRKYGDDAREAAKDLVYDYRAATNADMTKGGQILKLFTDEGIAGSLPFEEVRRKAFTMLDAARLNAVAEYLIAEAQFDEKAFEWQLLDKAAQRIKLNLRPILQGLQLTAAAADDPLIEAMKFLEEAARRSKPLTAYKEQDLPLRWVPERMKRYLYEKDGARRRLLADRYEFLLYRQLRNGLESGDIFCRDSVRFRSINDDLVDQELWHNDKETLIAKAGSDILRRPIRAHLAELKERLETRLSEVNRRIAAGENTYFKLKENGRWTLEYPGDEEETNHPFFDQLLQTDINSVLCFTHRQCGFMEAFTHRLGRYAKQAPNKSALIASLVGWGTNTGLPKMGQISDIGYHTLVSTSDNFLRPETLREANDVASNAIARLSIFRHYDIGGLLHSSSDGQKFEAAVSSFNARHSPKYFGLKKGIVSYTLVANHVPLNARNITADDHESHFVFDLLYNNSTDIQPELHSTDTHGTNNLNFALLQVFGSSRFTPRYKDIYDKVRNSLIAFQHPSRYGDAIIKPIRKIREDLIVGEWDECQRIFVSLALKESTQSTIVRKLSAQSRNSRAKRALWEYDSIYRSLYLLDYIDNPPLRQHVQKALNRGENYHQLRRAISYAGFGKLRFKTEYEQELWAECSRLLANCIILYNASILSRLLEHQERTGNAPGADATKKISPIAWQHINLQGRYEFQKQPDPLDVDMIIRTLTELSCDRGATQNLD